MITSSQSLAIYEILHRNFKSEQDAKELVKEIENVIEGRFLQERDRLATKEDIAKLEVKIAESKADLLKWMIILFAPFYVGMIVFLVKQFVR